ncbi:ABC transporter ATP-binding protein [Candidatus Woesearchaeota archaeon]|nr:ABC transporter ATP-binding protein [Candidatus Woesearchaeota archaeon]
MEFIQVKGVSKEYAKKPVLHDVSLNIQEGDIIGIVGQSGSGKTTLLNLISGFIEPTQGEVVYFSKVDQKPKNLHDNFFKIKRHIGFTPQHSSVYSKLSIKENILHFGHLYDIPKETLITNAKALLQFTGLYDDREKLAEHLSGGMRKRLDISCSLIHKPKILFLDEPTANLDPVTEREVVKLIQEVNKQGVTVIIASHHLESIENICTKLAIIKNGTLQSYGEIDDLRKPFLKPNLTINIRTGKDKEKIIALVKKLPVSKIIDQGDQLVLYPLDDEKAIGLLVSRLKEEGLMMSDIDVHQPSLRDMFTKLTQ